MIKNTKTKYAYHSDGYLESLYDDEGFVTILDNVEYLYQDRVVVAIAKVDGRTYVGYAIADPTDTYDQDFGEQLALARALRNKAVEKDIIANWNNDETEDDYKVLGCCEICGKAIFSDGQFIKSNGHLFCCDECLNEYEDQWDERDVFTGPDW